MSRSLLFLAALTVVACKTTETPAPVPVKVAEVKPVEVAPAPPPAPKIELPAPAALPMLPVGLPAVPASTENPTTAEKAELGFMLFFDKRLSKDGSAACAQCHEIGKAYTTGNALDAKVGGAMNKRNAPSMLNLGFHTTWYWDGRKASLEACAGAAWNGQLGADPVVVAQLVIKV